MTKDYNNIQTKNKSSSQKFNLQIQVSNFGPITQGDLCIKPLTIFVGPSNTGKSYLAILLYTLSKINKKAISFPYTPYIIKTSDQCRKFLRDFKEANKLNKEEILKKYADKESLQSFIKMYFHEYLNKWENQIRRCLSPLHKLIKKINPNQVI